MRIESPPAFIEGKSISDELENEMADERISSLCQVTNPGLGGFEGFEVIPKSDRNKGIRRMANS